MFPQLFQICSEKDVTRNTFSKVVFLCTFSVTFGLQTWSPTPPKTDPAGPGALVWRPGKTPLLLLKVMFCVGRTVVWWFHGFVGSVQTDL